jgi:hypothetical protein
MSSTKRIRRAIWTEADFKKKAQQRVSQSVVAPNCFPPLHRALFDVTNLPPEVFAIISEYVYERDTTDNPDDEIFLDLIPVENQLAFLFGHPPSLFFGARWDASGSWRAFGTFRGGDESLCLQTGIRISRNNGVRLEWHSHLPAAILTAAPAEPWKPFFASFTSKSDGAYRGDSLAVEADVTGMVTLSQNGVAIEGKVLETRIETKPIRQLFDTSCRTGVFEHGHGQLVNGIETDRRHGRVHFMSLKRDPGLFLGANLLENGRVFIRTSLVPFRGTSANFQASAALVACLDKVHEREYSREWQDRVFLRLSQTPKTSAEFIELFAP